MTDAPPTSDANKKRILVVEDDPSIQLGLRMSLEKEGYEVGIAIDGIDGLERLRNEPFDLCLLDIMLPRLNGYEVIQQLGHAAPPVVFLSARSNDRDKVMGLDLGAEDYITKPFSVPVLLARVRAALRRHGGPPPSIIRFGDVEVHPTSREVTRAREPVDLTATEFDILMTLARANGAALSRDDIFTSVWGPDHHGTRRTIDNFVAQLRHKLEADPSSPAHLLTVRGVGYRLVR